MNSADKRRRWAGVICLGVAILMVVWGHFFLPTSADPLLLLTFWTLCFVLTLTAIVIAFADLRALRQQTRAENRALFEETMHAIEKEVSRSATQH